MAGIISDAILRRRNPVERYLPNAVIVLGHLLSIIRMNKVLLSAPILVVCNDSIKEFLSLL